MFLLLHLLRKTRNAFSTVSLDCFFNQQKLVLYIFLRSLQNSEAHFRVKRQASGQKDQYYVELLLVLDPSIYELHRRFYQINDSSKIMSYMRLYYAHLIRGVSDRYEYSFRNDTNTSLTICLTNLLFINDVCF